MRAGRRPLRLALGGAVAVAVILASAGALVRGNDPLDRLPLSAWAPYWALDASTASLGEHGTTLREVSPFWFTATAPDVVAVDPNAPTATADGFVRAAREAGVAVIPSIVDGMAPRAMAAVLADPATRATHVDAIVRFAATGDYDGIDIDYENFAFADGRSTWATTRPNWVAFVTELGARLHADGRRLTVSIPPVFDGARTDESGYWVYDPGAIVDAVDQVRVMAYNYSTSAAGPIAPLEWVQRAIEGIVEVTDDRAKIVLGIPLYGYNWVTATTGTCPDGLAQGRTAVTPRTVGELIQRRSAVAGYDDELGESSFSYDLVVADGTTSCTQHRRVHYIDARGARERFDLAREARLGGVALWALGFDDPATWESIGPVVEMPPTVHS